MPIVSLDGGKDLEETSETPVSSAWIFQETQTRCILSGINVTMVRIKAGLLTKRDSNTLVSHSVTTSSSRSSQGWPKTEPFSGMSTSEEVSSDLESATPIQRMASNGGSLTQGLEPLDPRTERTSSFPTKQDKASESELLQSSDNGKLRTSRKSNGMEVQERTSVTTVASAWIAPVEETLITTI
jgi:hypothetical protein